MLLYSLSRPRPRRRARVAYPPNLQQATRAHGGRERSDLCEGDAEPKQRDNPDAHPAEGEVFQAHAVEKEARGDRRHDEAGGDTPRQRDTPVRGEPIVLPP